MRGLSVLSRRGGPGPRDRLKNIIFGVGKFSFRVLELLKISRKLTWKLKLSANSTVTRDQFSTFWWQFKNKLQFVVWTSKKAESRVSRSKGVIWGQIIDRKRGFLWLMAAWAMKPSGFMYFGKSRDSGFFWVSGFLSPGIGFLSPGFGIFSWNGISPQKANSAIAQNLGLWFWTVQFLMIAFY